VTLHEFLADARQFLSGQAELRDAAGEQWGEGSDRIDLLFPERTPSEDRSHACAARAWRRTRFDAGFGWIDGPAAYGGRGLSAEYRAAYQSLESQFTVPSCDIFIGTDGMIAPTTLEFGSEQAKDFYLRRFYRGDFLACQLFSEPGAGSDLPSLRTRANQDGDEWIVQGQKVWSSGAHLADVGLLLARNDDSKGRDGLTMFLVDMHAPGVAVVPLRQITGASSFNEVFLDEVVIPEWMRVGAVGAGWRVAMTTLLHERGMADLDRITMGPVRRLRSLIEHLGLDRDPVVRQSMADVYTHARVLEMTVQRSLVGKSGKSATTSVTKLAMTENLRRIAKVVSHVLGPKLVADTGEWGTYAWSEFVLWQCGLRIAGGTDEVQRNSIAERVLGLPK
jgi:alkylation response protein AidB-like acyl-CoA dehydrogenase